MFEGIFSIFNEPQNVDSVKKILKSLFMWYMVQEK